MPKKEINLEGMDGEFDDAGSLADAINSALKDADDAISKQEQANQDGPVKIEISDENEAPTIEEDEAATEESKETAESHVEETKDDQQDGLAELTEQPEEEDGEGQRSAKEMEYYDRLLRVMADFENYKKRVVREKQEFSRFAIEDLVTQLLPAMDNFERAISHCEESKDIDALLDGVKMIERQLKDVLRKFGVRSIESVGKAFDPAKHQAVQMQATTDHEPNTVLDEFQRGYFLHERLIRPAMVVVAQEGGVKEKENEDDLEEAEILEDGLEELDELEPID